MRLATRRWPGDRTPGSPTLLLIHGLTASSRTWWQIGPELADRGWQVLAVDLRCHGQSGCDGPIGDRDVSEDVHETLLAELGTDRVDVAWGHSLGGRTVLQLLRDHPHAASRAVLEDPPGRLRRDRAATIAEWRREIGLAVSDPASLVVEMRRTNPDWDERDVAENVLSLADCRIEPIAAAYASGYADAESAPELAPHLPVPTFLCLADEEFSVLTGADRAETIAALPRGSTSATLPGGHTLHRDCPWPYLAAIMGWLEGPRTIAA